MAADINYGYNDVDVNDGYGGVDDNGMNINKDINDGC